MTSCDLDLQVISWISAGFFLSLRHMFCESFRQTRVTNILAKIKDFWQVIKVIIHLSSSFLFVNHLFTSSSDNYDDMWHSTLLSQPFCNCFQTELPMFILNNSYHHMYDRLSPEPSQHHNCKCSCHLCPCRFGHNHQCQVCIHLYLQVQWK